MSLSFLHSIVSKQQCNHDYDYITVDIKHQVQSGMLSPKYLPTYKVTYKAYNLSAKHCTFNHIANAIDFIKTLTYKKES